MKILSRLFLALFLLIAPLSQVSRAAAQGEGPQSGSTQSSGSLIVSAPETGLFPNIQFRLDAYDARGNFIDSLQAEDVQVIEDGQAIKPQSLEKVQSGLQIIVALNIAPSMAKQAKGISGYQTIQKALIDWANSQPANNPRQPTAEVTQDAGQESPLATAPPAAQKSEDDFSLATPNGVSLTRERSPEQIVKALTDYQPDLAHAQPALGSLAEALDLATDPLDTPSMKRTILYVTPSLAPSNNTTIADLAKRAKSIGVRVNVWEIMDTPGSSANTNPSNPFEQLATTTGGQFQWINFSKALPEIEPLFQPLRGTYQITYPSAIQKSGLHSLSVQVRQAQASMASSESNFNLAVQPPNPIFLSPPVSIERSWTGNPGEGAVSTSAPAFSNTAESKDSVAPAGAAESAGTATSVDVVASSLTPTHVPLQIKIEFPDQHPRALKATRLFVNGKQVAENTTAPFDSFSWPISDITTPAKELLRVEAVDILGLSGSSIEIPVEILIDQPAKANLSQRVSMQGIIAVGAVSAAGVALTMVLLLTGSHRRARRKRQQVDKRMMNDPVTQPVLIQQDQGRQRKDQRRVAGQAEKSPAPLPSGGKPAGGRPASAWMNPIWPRDSAQNAPARLVALDENEQPITGGAILLSRQEITFGKDPQRATQVLDSPTVNDLHARLFRSPEGNFILADQGSIAGTWINYAPVTSGGARLEHGDLIHIGRVMFRFELTNPTQAEIKVIDLEQLP